VIPEQEHLVAGRVGDRAELTAAGELVVRELIASLPGENVAGRDVLAKPVEDVELLRGRQVDFVLAGGRRFRRRRHDRSYSEMLTDNGVKWFTRESNTGQKYSIVSKFTYNLLDLPRGLHRQEIQ